MHLNDIYKLTIVIHKNQEIFLVSVMKYRNSIIYVQRQMNTLLRQLEFVRVYIDVIVVRSKSLEKYIDYLRQLFELFVDKNISLNFNKIFLNYFEITLLVQKVNAFD